MIDNNIMSYNVDKLSFREKLEHWKRLENGSKEDASNSNKNESGNDYDNICVKALESFDKFVNAGSPNDQIESVRSGINDVVNMVKRMIDDPKYCKSLRGGGEEETKYSTDQVEEPAEKKIKKKLKKKKRKKGDSGEAERKRNEKQSTKKKLKKKKKKMKTKTKSCPKGKSKKKKKSRKVDTGKIRKRQIKRQQTKEKSFTKKKKKKSSSETRRTDKPKKKKKKRRKSRS